MFIVRLLAILIAASTIIHSTRANGPTASDAGLSSYFIPNRLLYDMSKDSPSHPDEATVKEWLQIIQAAIQGCVSLVYSARLHQVLKNRVNFIQWKVKRMKGTTKRQRYLQLDWEFKVAKVELQSADGSSTTRKRTRTAKHYSKRHERRMKRQKITDITNALTFLEDRGYGSGSTSTAVGVIIVNHDTRCKEVLELHHGLDLVFNLKEEKVDRHSEEMVLMMLYIKDKHNISGRAYHEIASLCKQMPRHYKLKEKIAKLNSKWHLFPTPEGTCGVQQRIKERLEYCVAKLLEDEKVIFHEDVVRVKLTGDGTRLGKHLHVVNFAFTVLEEGDKAHGPSGNHCVAIFKEEESYASMKKCLQDIVKEVKELTTISVSGRILKVRYYLGGDWKFLAMITGIDSASSTYACIWCKCPALERHDTAQKWSISDTSLGARTITENQNIACSRSKQRFNVSNEPVFPMIPLTRVVVERVADTLIDLLLLELRRLDKIHTSLKIKGLDVLHYLKRLNIVETFPNIPDSSKVQTLWQDLLAINTILSVRPASMTATILHNFEEKSKLFVQRFVEVYPAKHVTPYMHCMMQHVGEFFKIHGALLPFTQQGLEKYNDSMTKDYFRSSSHRGTECLTQIIQKQNRLEYFEQAGAIRTTPTVKCSNCRGEGHNSPQT